VTLLSYNLSFASYKKNCLNIYIFIIFVAKGKLPLTTCVDDTPWESCELPTSCLETVWHILSVVESIVGEESFSLLFSIRDFLLCFNGICKEK
jgi:hypothetical protein